MASVACNMPPDAGVSAAEAASILDDVRHAMERDPQEARAAALRLVALFTPPSEAASSVFRGGLAPWQRQRIDKYIREHLEQPMRLGQLAALVCLSVGHFSYAFKESFGDTPHAHIIHLRLTLAKQMMLATRDPLSGIALACGFADQAHFSRLFRQRVGEPPNAWRRRNLTDGPAMPTGGHFPGTPVQAETVSWTRAFVHRPKKRAA